jgi:uncharacterized membrane protein (DUF106 family)
MRTLLPKGKKMNYDETMKMAKHLQDECQKAYNQGVQDALEEMSQLYEGITDTDLWHETFAVKEGE